MNFFNFFFGIRLPDAPSEPDIEPYEPSEPINIPLRDVSII